MLNEDACHRKVLLEKLTKMSYLFDMEQKLYTNINVFEEYMNLGYELCSEPIFGYYNDSEFLKRIKQYELQRI